MKRRSSRAGQSELKRVRNLIALDAGNVMARLEKRKDEMITLFSRLRDREPMLGTLASWFDSVSFRQLALLEVRDQLVVSRFYEVVEELRWYFKYTEDMPSTAQQIFTQLHRQLGEAHAKLTALLGVPHSDESAAVVEGEVLHRAVRRRKR